MSNADNRPPVVSCKLIGAVVGEFRFECEPNCEHRIAERTLPVARIVRRGRL